MIYTVFPTAAGLEAYPDAMPQDFASYDEAIEFASLCYCVRSYYEIERCCDG